MYTTEDLIRQIRSQTQEENTNGPVSDIMIMDALNRAQDQAFDLMIKHYPDPLIKEHVHTLDANNEFTLLETAFQDRLMKIDAYNGTLYHELKPISYRDIAKVAPRNLSGYPTHYAIIGRQARVLPTPPSSFTYRVWYVREIDNLVKTKASISAYGTTTVGGIDHSYVAVSDTSSLSEGGYVNIIDSSTGEIKHTVEILSINSTTGQVIFNASPTRSTVQNRDISSEVTSVEEDDLICSIDGTCVPFFKKPLMNYIIQYAVYEIRRALGYDVAMERDMLSRTEKSVERTWAARENTRRVTNTNRLWTRRRR